MAVSESELVAWLRTELEQAEGYNGGELQAVRKAALDRYYGRPFGNEIKGRSDAQSNDIADMVEALIAQLLPGFGGDAPAEFEAESDDDVERAQVESDVVNWVLIEANRGYVLFQEAMRDALLLRNAWVKVWLDESKSVDRQRYTAVPVEAVAQLETRPTPPGIVVEVERVREAGEGLVDFTLKVTKTRQRLRVAAVDPAAMSWSANYDSVFVDDIPFLAEQWYPTRSELVQRGYSREKVAALKASDLQDSPGTMARADGQGFGRTVTDPTMERVRCWWIHYRYDSDGDGVAELHRILYGEGAAESQILEDEVVPWIQYATGTAFLQPHRLSGLGLYDKMRHTEENKTAILRQWLDNLAVNNNVRLAINTRAVALEDAAVSRPGGIVRVNGEPGQSILPIPALDVGQSALAALEYQDKVRSERAGASLDLQSAQLQIAGDTAHGIERQISSREQLAAMMARTMAETLVRQVYLLVHRGLREWITQPIRVRVRGQFIEQTPADWPDRERVNIKTGLSVGERTWRRQALEVVLAQQEKLAAAGYDGVLVDAQQYYAALMDWTRAAELDNGNRYFTDPTTPAAQKAQQARQQQQQAQQAIQLQIAATAAAAQQQAAQIEQAMAKYKQDTELAFKYWSEVLQAEIAELKAGTPEGDGEMEALESAGVGRSVLAMGDASNGR